MHPKFKCEHERREYFVELNASDLVIDDAIPLFNIPAKHTLVGVKLGDKGGITFTLKDAAGVEYVKTVGDKANPIMMNESECCDCSLSVGFEEGVGTYVRQTSNGKD